MSARWPQKCLPAGLQGRFMGVDATATPTITVAEIMAGAALNNLHEPCIIGFLVTKLVFRDVIVLNILEGIQSAVTGIFSRISHSHNLPEALRESIWYGSANFRL
ncbi:hypothetical protein EDB19DRAFT_1827278 [Suillus lakei]|nr:hypothetical protein EDB19DRAFT_1827278 [Suillus lakei]